MPKPSAFERLTHPFPKNRQPFERLIHHDPFTKNLHPVDSRSRYPAVNGSYDHRPLCLSLQTAYSLRLSVCPLSNGVRINSLNIRSLLYWLKRKIYKTYVIIIIIQPLAKTGKVISSKEYFQSTQLYRPSSPLYHFVNRNGRRFDSVGSLNLFSSGYTRCYVHLSES